MVPNHNFNANWNNEVKILLLSHENLKKINRIKQQVLQPLIMTFENFLAQVETSFSAEEVLLHARMQ